MLLTSHKPHGKKPSPKWFARFMKQRSRSNGSLSLTLPAEKEATTCQGGFLSNVPTAGATEAVPPSNFGDIINASIVAAKPFIKLLERSRIINASNRVSWIFHGRTLHHVAG
jgi:hypothetical protein